MGLFGVIICLVVMGSIVVLCWLCVEWFLLLCVVCVVRGREIID